MTNYLLDLIAQIRVRECEHKSIMTMLRDQSIYYATQIDNFSDHKEAISFLFSTPVILELYGYEYRNQIKNMLLNQVEKTVH